jgi:hypothetical protein
MPIAWRGGAGEFREEYPFAIRAELRHGGYIRKLSHRLHLRVAQSLLADQRRKSVAVEENRIAIGSPCMRIVVRRPVSQPCRILQCGTGPMNFRHIDIARATGQNRP